MDNVEFFTVTELNGTEIEWVKITVGENAYVWQPKSAYDKQQVEHLTEIPTPPAE